MLRTLGAGLVLIACSANGELPDRKDTGTLVIAGGGVAATNTSIYRAFLDAMPEPGAGEVAIISAASGSPAESLEWARQTFQSYGVAEERILTIRLALLDDETTADVDESEWSGNASDPVEVEKVSRAQAIWISGGDQSRLTEVLYGNDGATTPLLAEMRRVLANGGVIGGTSAGAAIMSDPMITGGRTLPTLLGRRGSEDYLSTARGLGFFEHGLVDQHFGERARLGRLAAALCQSDPGRRVGFGIDEDTAMVYSVEKNEIEVVGAGSVTVVDAGEATCELAGGRFDIRGLSVSVLSARDFLNLADREYAPAAYLTRIVDKQYYDLKPESAGGMALPSTGLGRLLGGFLLDNKGSTQLDRYSFDVSPESGRSGISEGAGFIYRFSQSADSEGYWGYDDDGVSRYSVIGVRMDIIPIDISVTPVARGLAGGDSRRLLE